MKEKGAGAGSTCRRQAFQPRVCSRRQEETNVTGAPWVEWGKMGILFQLGYEGNQRNMCDSGNRMVFLEETPSASCLPELLCVCVCV